MQTQYKINFAKKRGLYCRLKSIQVKENLLQGDANNELEEAPTLQVMITYLQTVVFCPCINKSVCMFNDASTCILVISH